jgi:hypothetical protein
MIDENSYIAAKEDIEKKFTAVRKEDFLQHVQSLHADSDVGFSHEFDVSKNLELSPFLKQMQFKLVQSNISMIIIACLYEVFIINVFISN